MEEPILEPGRKIVDPHHHLFGEGSVFGAYSLEDLWSDTSTHNVQQTVYVQCYEQYDTDGPEHLAPVGETRWVHGIAQRAEATPDKAQIAAIVAGARLMAGDGVQELLEAHLDASPRVRGVRDIAAWAEGEGVHRSGQTDDALMYEHPDFREGFARLAPLGLSFDAYHYHNQTRSVAALARAYPETTIIVDHLSTPLGIGPYAGRRAEIFREWSRDVRDLAGCENVYMKLGGMAMPWNGFGWDTAERPPTSDEFVVAQEDYYHCAIDAFGPARCMFESNFPVDRMSLPYATLWNAFKKMAARYAEDEKDALFFETASRVYRLRD